MTNFIVTPQKPFDEHMFASKQLTKSVYSLGLSFLQNTRVSTSNNDGSSYSTESNQSFDELSHLPNSSNTIGFCFANVDSSRYKNLDDKYISLKSTWILLDTQSNCDIFKNRALLKNIHKKPGERLILKSNGDGDIRTNQVGNIHGYGEVWFNKQSMANILSFANVKKKFRITISTGPDDPCPTFCVHKKDGSVMEFKEHSLGLYVHDVASNKSNILNNPVKHYSFLSTVAFHEANYSPRDIKRAKQALDLYRRLDRPSKAAFLCILNENLIHNTEISATDANLAFHIY